MVLPLYAADDPQADKLLLVMEYAEAGPVMRGDHSINKVPLAEGVALKFFRDVLQVSSCCMRLKPSQDKMPVISPARALLPAQ